MNDIEELLEKLASLGCMGLSKHFRDVPAVGIYEKLTSLDLPEKMVARVLDIFDTYLCSKATLSQPAGIIEFRDNLTEIEALSKKLYKKLQKITSFERQMMRRPGQPEIRKIAMQIKDLSITCACAKKTEHRFSRREPFLSQLTIDLWELLERNGIPVKVYKNNQLCLVLNVLLNEQEDSERAFNLLRDVSKRFKKKPQKFTP